MKNRSSIAFFKASAISSAICVLGLLFVAWSFGYFANDAVLSAFATSTQMWLFILSTVAAAYSFVFVFLLGITRLLFALNLLSKTLLILIAVAISLTFGYLLGYSPPIDGFFFLFIGGTTLALLAFLLPAVLLWWRIAHHP